MFQKYKYVLAVYRERSFTGAAQKLFISQPSLSVAIGKIEKEIGGALFERSGSGVKPTEIGMAYIAAAQKMRQAEDEFAKKCLDINELQTGKLVVGGSNYRSSDVLPKIITLFRERFPKVEITLVEANSVRLREMLHDEEVDMIIDNFEDGGDLYEAYPLVREKILMCVPASNPLNEKLREYRILPEEIYNGTANYGQIPAVDIRCFKDEKFILLKHGNDMYHRAMAILGEKNITPDVAFQVDQMNISYALTESGIGVNFAADTLFKYRKHLGDVILYQLDTRYASRVLYIAHKKNRYCTKAMAEFIKAAQEIVHP